jgi:lysozyme family protein
MRALDARQSAQVVTNATAGRSPLPTGPLVVDGVFGHLTCAALQRSLNERHGEHLDVDGSCGRLSYSALQRVLDVEVTGERDEATVKALQRRLGVVPVDGEWGPDTVERLQVALNAHQF